MRDSSDVFYKIVLLPPGGLVRMTRRGNYRLLPLSQAGKRNQVFEKAAAETRRLHNKTKKIIFRSLASS
jgi:hypothetical protein